MYKKKGNDFKFFYIIYIFVELLQCNSPVIFHLEWLPLKCYEFTTQECSTLWVVVRGTHFVRMVFGVYNTFLLDCCACVGNYNLCVRSGGGITVDKCSENV